MQSPMPGKPALTELHLQWMQCTHRLPAWGLFSSAEHQEMAPFLSKQQLDRSG